MFKYVFNKNIYIFFRKQHFGLHKYLHLAILKITPCSDSNALILNGILGCTEMTMLNC